MPCQKYNLPTIPHLPVFFPPTFSPTKQGVIPRLKIQQTGASKILTFQVFTCEPGPGLFLVWLEGHINWCRHLIGTYRNTFPCNKAYRVDVDLVDISCKTAPTEAWTKKGLHFLAPSPLGPVKGSEFGHLTLLLGFIFGRLFQTCYS